MENCCHRWPLSPKQISDIHLPGRINIDWSCAVHATRRENGGRQAFPRAPEGRNAMVFSCPTKNITRPLPRIHSYENEQLTRRQLQSLRKLEPINERSQAGLVLTDFQDRTTKRDAACHVPFGPRQLPKERAHALGGMGGASHAA